MAKSKMVYYVELDSSVDLLHRRLLRKVEPGRGVHDVAVICKDLGDASLFSSYKEAYAFAYQCGLGSFAKIVEAKAEDVASEVSAREMQRLMATML